MSDKAERFECWGICELMGHQRVAGRISEQALAGTNLLRVDVPQPPKEGEQPVLDAFRTVYYGSSAIYALHVTSEDAARLAAKGQGARPAYAWELEQARLPPPPAPVRRETVYSGNGPDTFVDDHGDEFP